MKVGSLLLVYGTLRVGESHDLSRDRRALKRGVDRVNGEMYHLGHYPGVKAEAGHFDAGKPSIVGDVFELLDASIITLLDAYECYPTLYDRIETETAEGRHAWIYTYNHDVSDGQLIASGNWPVGKLASLGRPEAAMAVAMQAAMGEMG